MKSVADAVKIPFFIPPMKNRKFKQHVISKGDPEFYRPEDLRDTGIGDTPWVCEFEEMFLGLYLALDAPVPYAFLTPDDKVRSLDAGCLKWLENRVPSWLQFKPDYEGYISTVVPLDVLIARYAPIHTKLRERIINAEASDA